MTAQRDEEGSNLVTKTIGFDEIATKVVNLEVAGLLQQQMWKYHLYPAFS